jgi:hypothetical protein
VAAREVGAKTNEIPEFQPLMEQIDDEDLDDAVVTLDALCRRRHKASDMVPLRSCSPIDLECDVIESGVRGG